MDSCALLFTQNYELATFTSFLVMLDVNKKEYLIVYMDPNDTAHFLFDH